MRLLVLLLGLSLFAAAAEAQRTVVPPEAERTAPAAEAQRRVGEVEACVGGGASDRDLDGLSDACELHLAERFAPVLVVREGGCNWDDSSVQGRLGGGYRFVVERVDSVVRIAYLPAYFRDCGWSGPKCWLPWVDCSPHAGDSEFIVVDVRPDALPGSWSVVAIFLSAHCFGRSGNDCRWYRGTELERFEWQDGAPVVWIAEGRHANYPTRAACDRGHHGLDTCDRNRARYRFPVGGAAHNLGSATRPVPAGGCVAGSELSTPRVDPRVVECFWRADARFRGWQGGVTGVTGYRRYLVEIAGFGGP